MTRLALAFAMACITTSGCGSGSPTAPSKTATPPSTTIIAVGSLTSSGCSGGGAGVGSCRYFTFEVKNTGQGCVRRTDLHGTVTWNGPNGETWSGGEWALPLGSQVVNNGVFKPGETAPTTNAGSDIPWFSNSWTYRITVKQTPVWCN